MDRKKSLLKEARRLVEPFFKKSQRWTQESPEKKRNCWRKSRAWKECGGTRFSPKLKKGENFAAEGDVARIAGSGSQTLELEAELLSSDVDD